MKPATIDADMSNVDGQPVTVDVGDFDMRLADSDERGVFRDNAEWNDKAFVCDHGRVILDIHEWEDDEPEYDRD